MKYFLKYYIHSSDYYSIENQKKEMIFEEEWNDVLSLKTLVEDDTKKYVILCEKPHYLFIKDYTNAEEEMIREEFGNKIITDYSDINLFYKIIPNKYNRIIIIKLIE